MYKYCIYHPNVLLSFLFLLSGPASISSSTKQVSDDFYLPSALLLYVCLCVCLCVYLIHLYMVIAHGHTLLL